MKRPAIDLQEIFLRDRTVREMKIVEVTEKETAGVPNFSVGLDQLAKDVLRDSDILPKIGRRHPKPEDLGAIFIDHLLGGDHIAGRFRHLLSGTIDDEAVRENRVIGGAPVGLQRRQEATVEPAAVLIRSFQIKIGRPLQRRPPF